MTLNDKGTLQNHIEDIRGKVHIATQTILNVVAYQDYRAIEMQTIWKLYKTCIVPIITYSAEAWNPTAEEYRQLEDIQNTALRNILDTNNRDNRDNSLLVVELSDVNYICKLLSTHSSKPCNGFSSFGSARSG